MFAEWSRRTVTRLLFIVPVLPAATLAEDVPATSYVERLGAPTYSEREAAEAALLYCGYRAIPALRSAVRSQDPEVRFRSRRLLWRVSLGIDSRWSAQDEALAKSFFSTSDPRAAVATVTTLSGKLGTAAFPFLLSAAGGSSKEGAEAALACIKAIHDPVPWHRVTWYVGTPRTPYQDEALKIAHSACNGQIDALSSLDGGDLTQEDKRLVLELAVQRLEYLHRHRRISDMLRLVCAYRSIEEDARLLYLHADGLIGFHQADAARRLQEKALALDIRSEEEHYATAEMLRRLGNWSCATREWKRVLELPPDQGARDITACIRLAETYERWAFYAAAASRLEEALRCLETKKEGTLRLVNCTEEAVAEQIHYLKRMAAAHPTTREPSIPESGSSSGFGFVAEGRVKDNRGAELDAALAGVCQLVAFGRRPNGVRLFTADGAKLVFDQNNHSLVALQNGSRCTKAIRIESDRRDARVAVAFLDGCHIIDVDAQTGDIRLVDSYELDYTLRLVPELRDAVFSQLRVEINGQPVDAKALLTGVPYDYLALGMQSKVSYTDVSGKGRNQTGGGGYRGGEHGRFFAGFNKGRQDWPYPFRRAALPRVESVDLPELLH